MSHRDRTFQPRDWRVNKFGLAEDAGERKQDATTQSEGEADKQNDQEFKKSHGLMLLSNCN